MTFFAATFSGRARSNKRLTSNLFDSDEEASPATQTREARYGHRSSQSRGNTDTPVEEGQDQGTRALHQTTQMCVIESHQNHHHQAVKTGI